MTEEQEKQVKELVDNLLSMSLDELHEVSKNHVNNPFLVFQEMSDALLENDEEDIDN